MASADSTKKKSTKSTTKDPSKPAKTVKAKSSAKPSSTQVDLEALMAQISALTQEVASLKNQASNQTPEKNWEGLAERLLQEMESESESSEVSKEESSAILESMAHYEEPELNADQEADPTGQTEFTAEQVTEQVQAEADLSQLSNEEIAAMISMGDAEPTEPIVDPQTLETDSVEPEDEEWGDDLSGLLSQADEQIHAQDHPSEPGVIEGQEEKDQEEEIDLDNLTEEQLQALVAKSIADQNVQAEQASADQPQMEPAQELIPAEGISALLTEPDPIDIPEHSERMSPDELQALLSQASQTPEVHPVDMSQEPIAPEQEAAESAEPHVSLEGNDIGAIKLVPPLLAIRAMAVPVGFQEGKLTCRIAEPIDEPALQKLSAAIGMGVVCIKTPILEVVQELRAIYADANLDLARSDVLSSERKSGSWRKSA